MSASHLNYHLLQACLRCLFQRIGQLAGCFAQLKKSSPLFSLPTLVSADHREVVLQRGSQDQEEEPEAL